MMPLRVTARLRAALALPERPPDLDALLTYAVCVSEGRDPPAPGAAVPFVEIPLQRSACGRVWMASAACAEVEEMERGRFTTRHFPLGEAQYLADDRLRRINRQAGPQKSFRLSLERGFLRADTITWYCVGDEVRVRGLLGWITHLGKRRGVGNGAVDRWEVCACEPWGEGFPVLREGRVLRNLPLDYPGVREGVQAFACVAPPYWERDREEVCWCPA